jgi:purine-binding chemotaxis protein CheW
MPVVELADTVPGATPLDRGAGSSLLVVLGRERGRLGLRVGGFEGVVELDDRAADPKRSDELIELDGELVRYVDPESLLPSGASQLWDEGGFMEESRTEAEPVQVVAFRVGGEEFGIDVMKAQRVLKLPEIRAVPRAPEFVEGVVALEDAVVPVIDMRKRFSVPAAELAPAGTLLVVDSAENRVGLVVDEVPGVVNIPVDAVKVAPEFFKGLAGRYLQGIAEDQDRLILLLDLDEILSSKERIALDKLLEAARDAMAPKHRAAARPKRKKRDGRRKKKGDD